MDPLWHLGIPGWHLLIRGAIVYLFILVLFRLAGKRQVGQMGAGEFVMLLLISNSVQNAMNGGDNSLTAGLILSSVLMGLAVVTSYMTYRWKWMERLVESRPTLLIHKGAVVRKNLKRELLSEDDLLRMVRKQGADSLREVEDAILETDGSVSVIRKSGSKEN